MRYAFVGTSLLVVIAFLLLVPLGHVEGQDCGSLSNVCWSDSDVPKCPDPHGSATQQMARDLNLFKNNVVIPDQADIRVVTIQELLAPGDDTNRFKNGTAAAIVAYVVGVKVGGVETTNCEHKEARWRDTHIELAATADPKTPENKRVISEVTPHTRPFPSVMGGGKSTAQLEKLLLGKKVRIRGWMLFDAEHACASENTNPRHKRPCPGPPQNWRATAWEPAHPITSLEVIP
jgi:hypothetical protein